jgi:Histidine phosphatase superfamily (branch 2)
VCERTDYYPECLLRFQIGLRKACAQNLPKPPDALLAAGGRTHESVGINHFSVVSTLTPPFDLSCPATAVAMGPSSASETIALRKVDSPRTSEDVADEEREMLLESSPSKLNILPRRQTIGAISQIILFTIIGLIIALASGVFAYSLRGRVISNKMADFVHSPLPRMKNPSLLKYFGGMGPFMGGHYIKVPDSCQVNQVHLLSRHGERYPTNGMGNIIMRFAQNISVVEGNNFESTLAFLNNWKLTTNDWLYSPSDQLEQETVTGPAAGSLRMFTLGNQFRARYENIWNFQSRQRMKVWSSDSRRVIHSARYFSAAFFGAEADVSVQVIPETQELWGDTLTTTYLTY